MFLALSLSVFVVLPVAAQSPRASEIFEASLRTGWLTERGTYMTGLHLRLAPGWMTYWRHPGESGLAPQIDTYGSDNMAHLAVHWPEPRLIMSSGSRAIGYTDEVIVPIEITPANRQGAVQFNATVQMGVCREVCIPVEFPVSAVLTGAGAPDGAISAALARVPQSARSAGLRAIDCALAPERDGIRVTVRMTMPALGPRELMVIEMPGASLRARGQMTQRNGDILEGSVRMSARGGALGGVSRSKLRMTVLSERGAVTHQGCALN